MNAWLLSPTLQKRGPGDQPGPPIRSSPAPLELHALERSPHSCRPRGHSGASAEMDPHFPLQHGGGQRPDWSRTAHSSKRAPGFTGGPGALGQHFSLRVHAEPDSTKRGPGGANHRVPSALTGPRVAPCGAVALHRGGSTPPYPRPAGAALSKSSENDVGRSTRRSSRPYSGWREPRGWVPDRSAGRGDAEATGISCAGATELRSSCA